MKRLLTTITCFMVASMVATQSQAVVLSGFSINLANTGEGALAGTLAPLDEFNFRGIAHNTITDVGAPNGLPDVGDLSRVDGLGQVTQLTGNGMVQNTSSAGEILNTNFELTFDFSVPGIVTGGAPLSTFVHTAAGSNGTDGLLDFYVDSTPDAQLLLNTGGGAISGITDGTQFAQFRVLAGDGGNLNLNTLDGSDDASFELVSALPGVLIGPGGEDLGLMVAGGAQVLIAFSDSNFDLDFDDDNIINSGTPAGWPHPLPAGALGPNNHFALEDGSLSLRIVPEPASSLAFAALGLVGLGARRRRRK